MEYVFYLDVFFLTMLFLNLISLYLAACMGRFGKAPGRMILSAAAGSVWNCILVLYPVFSAPAELLLTVFAAGSFMTAFSFSLRSAKEILAADGFLAASVFLSGGLLAVLKDYFWMSDGEACVFLAAASLGAGLFFRETLKERERGKERFPVWLYYRGRKKKFLALADSGNRLREPVTGKPVSVIGEESCRGFCDTVSGVIFIPYRAVGTDGGMLPGIIFEKMEICRNGRLLEIKKPIVAVAREPLSGNGDFSMLIPEEFIIARSR